MKTLHLNLKRKWFDMIKAGIKTEEYRDLKLYWAKRLCSGLIYIKNHYTAEDCIHTFEEFDTITFSNGYAKDRDQFEIELKSITIDEGNPEWGAEKGKYYFVLKMGEMLK